MDIAELGIKVSSKGVGEANASLEALVVSAGKAEKATGSLERTYASSGNATKIYNSAVKALEQAQVKLALVEANSAAKSSVLEAARSKVANATTVVENVTKQYADELKRERAATEAATAAALAHKNVVALAAKEARAAATAASLQQKAAAEAAANMGKIIVPTNRAGDASKIAAHHMNNMVYQLNDVAVTAAMGMNPLMIMMQQGSQMGQIFATSGSSLGTWAKALGLTNPIVLAVTAVLGMATLSFNVFKKEVDKSADNKAFLQSLGLSEKEIRKLGNTSVTTGDMIKGLWKTIEKGMRLDKTFKYIAEIASKSFKVIMNASKVAFQAVYAGTVGLFNASILVFSRLSNVIGEMFVNGVNLAIRAINWMIEKSTGGINVLINKANSISGKVGIDPIGTLDAARIPELTNKNAGATVKLIVAASNEISKAYGDAGKSVDGFFSDWKKNSIEASRDRLREAAEAAGYLDPEKPKKDKKKKEKEEKDTVIVYPNAIRSIIKEANDAIADHQAKIDALNNSINLTGEALSRENHYIDLKNQATKANVDIDEKIKTLTEEKAKATGEELKQIEAEIAARQASKIIFNEETEAKLRNVAAQKASLETQEKTILFRQDLNQTIQDYIKQVQDETNVVFMSAEAAEAYYFKQSKLNDAIKTFGDLASIPKDAMEAINSATEKFTAANHVKKLNEQTLEWRDSLKSTFTEMVKGSMSFREALNSILNKLLEMSANELFDNLWSMGKRGKGSSGEGTFGGGVWSTVANVASSLFKKNALGDVYNNSPSLSAYSGKVVNQPTPFMFANGAGLMGEAGPEAIMPLKRGSDGKLGVAGTGGAQIITLPISIGGEKIDERIIAISGGVAQEVTGRAISGLGKSQSRNAAYRVR